MAVRPGVAVEGVVGGRVPIEGSHRRFGGDGVPGGDQADHIAGEAQAVHERGGLFGGVPDRKPEGRVPSPTVASAAASRRMGLTVPPVRSARSPPIWARLAAVGPALSRATRSPLPLVITGRMYIGPSLTLKEVVAVRPSVPVFPRLYAFSTTSMFVHFKPISERGNAVSFFLTCNVTVSCDT